MLSLIIASAIVTVTIPQPEKIDCERMLDAIAVAENWDKKSEGKAGEWGEFQMTPTVWRKTRIGKRKTMQQATPEERRAGAREDLLVRIATLQVNHFTISPFIVALAWNAGLTATIGHNTSKIKQAYAERCATIYDNETKNP